MKASDYFRMYMGMAQLDEDFEPFTFEYGQYDDETEEDAVDRWLWEQGVFKEDEAGVVITDYDRATSIHPSLAKMLQARDKAILQSRIDELLEGGVISQSVDENGDAIYMLEDGYEEKAKMLGFKKIEDN